MESQKLKKLLMEQKEKTNLERKRLYALFLKRKRIEANVTLTELAKGVCTASYLSRIENNVVDVDEEYFTALFRKLNIDFKVLKEAKDYRILESLLECYLLNDLDKGRLIVEEALSTTFYVEIEYELMILFDSIIKGLYSEANEEIIKLSGKVDLLIDEELITYLFLCGYYAYKIGNGVFAFDQILVLCESNHLNGVYKYAIYDLALDIFIYTGMHEMFFKYYRLISDEDYKTKYNVSFLKHKAQLVYLEYNLRKDITHKQLTEIKYLIDENEQENIEWLILKNYYRFNDYYSIISVLKREDPTPRTLALEAAVCLKIERPEYFTNFLKRRGMINFETKDYHYEKICNIFTMIRQGIQSSEVLRQLRDLLDDEIIRYHESFFLNIIKVIYAEYAFKIGKYKDVASKLIEIEKRQHSLPYFR